MCARQSALLATKKVVVVSFDPVLNMESTGLSDRVLATSGEKEKKKGKEEKEMPRRLELHFRSVHFRWIV